MLPDERDRACLWDMIDALEQIVAFTKNITLEEFQQDRKCQMAVERAFEITGEAARNVSPEFKKQHENVPWSDIVGQRNVLAHQYGTINLRMIRKSAKEEVPNTLQQLESISGSRNSKHRV